MSANRIYLDNAATSWPKPESVYQAVDHYQRSIGAAAGRSVYREAGEVARLVERTRQQLAALIGAEEPSRVIFTLNGTDALNLALHGLLRSGDHVVTTMAEHNSVLRPLRFLEQHRGVEVTRVRCDRRGWVDPAEIQRALGPRTRLIALTHASNVTGTLQAVEEVGRLAAEYEVRLLVDAAQSVGQVPIHVGQLRVDLLAAPGHKGLLGPLGTGFLYVRPGLEHVLEPVRQGGTGSQSERDEQPDYLPDKYEPGNLNVAGIAGLRAGLEYVVQTGVEQIQRHHQQLVQQLRAGLEGLSGIELLGPEDASQAVGVVSLTASDYDPQELAGLLDATFQIQVRSGMHCAPLMHQCLGTAARGGTVRLSVGAFNTPDEIERTIAALREVAAAI